MDENKFIDALGKERACVIAMEEFAELIQAVSKGIRGKLDYDNLCEEIADTILVTKWVEQIFGVEKEDVNRWMRYKRERMAKRLELNGKLD